MERYREVVAVAKKKQLAPGFLAYGPVETRFSNKVEQEARKAPASLPGSWIPGFLLHPNRSRSRHGRCFTPTAMVQVERGLFSFALWLAIETAAGITRENLTVHMMQNKIIVCPLLVTGLILLIPFFGNLYVDGWNWPFPAFIWILSMIPRLP